MVIKDTQMRKRLPAWILEGLEKAEREKQKKAEKEEADRKRKEREEERQRRREEKGIGKFVRILIVFPLKIYWKFLILNF